MLLTTVRKSVDEIKAAGPGDSYVYIANDIDVPEGTSLAIGTYNSGPRDNSVLAPGFNADGSVNRTRQYYLTYRAVPSPLKLVKTDSDDASKPVAGATYSLYKADGTLVKEGITTGADGTFTSGDILTKTELTALVQNTAATADLLTKGIYQDGDKFYLNTGRLLSGCRLHLQRDMSSIQIRFHLRWLLQHSMLQMRLLFPRKLPQLISQLLLHQPQRQILIQSQSLRLLRRRGLTCQILAMQCPLQAHLQLQVLLLLVLRTL